MRINSPLFQSALSDFTYDVACGGAIRHLADLGYTVHQITERLDFLNRKCEENGERASYITCDFGWNAKVMEEALKVLDERQKEYIQGVLWEKKRMYHRLTLRMREITARLYEAGSYSAICYFVNTGEKISLPMCRDLL